MNWLAFLQNKIKKDPRLLIVSLLLVMGTFIFVMTFSNVAVKTYDIERFSMADETIRSPITIENKKATEQKKREAVQAVQDQYTVSREITEEQVSSVEEIFSAIQAIQKPTNKDLENSDNSNDPLTKEERLQKLQRLLTQPITRNLKTEVLSRLLQASDQQRSLAQELMTTSLYEIMNDGIKEEEVPQAKQSFQKKLTFSSLDPSLKDTLRDLADFVFVANAFIDEEKTIKAKKQAVEHVEPVLIRKGMVLVFEGEPITNQVYEDLSLVGLLDNKSNYYPYVGLVLFILLCLGILAYELKQLHINTPIGLGTVSSLFLITFITFIFMKVVSIFQSPIENLYIVVPIAVGGILLKLLVNERLAIVMAILYALFGMVVFNNNIPGALDVHAGIYFLISQISAIYLLNNVQDRMAVLKAGLGVSVVNIVIISVFLLLSFEGVTLLEIGIQAVLAIASAFLSAVLALGLLPFFEAGLGILTDSKLLALANPNHPLLRKVLTETPGTYHHSVMVANLSETACEAIGANGLLARVASYYHDLGKTVSPHYFIENQRGIKNPHDFIEPEQSAELIIRHSADGAKMLRQKKMPKEIIDITEQHHGTSLLKYFYYEAKKQSTKVNEGTYRYPGPKPQTREAAIICVCDSIEAAVRSLEQPSTQDIEDLVDSIINDKLKDGQLNENPLTLSELEKVKIAVCETLQGIFHSRIQYPTPSELVKEAN